MVIRLSILPLILAVGALLGWLTAHGQLAHLLHAQDKNTPGSAITTSDMLDRTVLPIPEPKVAPLTELDARNADERAAEVRAIKKG